MADGSQQSELARILQSLLARKMGFAGVNGACLPEVARGLLGFVKMTLNWRIN